MTLRPLYGHHDLRAQLATSAHAGRLPASLLLQGARGVGKQRLAIWLGQLLLCERAIPERLDEPCAACQQCRYSLRLVHPDLHWFFPRPRLKDGDPSHADVAADLGEAIAERVEADGLWAPPPGGDGLHIATMRALVHRASSRPAMAKRAVFIVGDAERLVSQEGADQAANAFLKVLEEPPPGTTLILTSSEPMSLLPTIRSRVVSIRVPSVARADVEAFLDDPAVQRKLAGTVREESIARASGAPGALLAAASTAEAFGAARRLLDSALQPSGAPGSIDRIKAAARQGVSGARGAFSDMLDALTVLLHDRVRRLTHAGQDSDARRTAMAMILVEDAKLRANGNVSPQLLGASLIAKLHATLRP
jgi:DNA polymerase-3 subunit delta'